MSHPEMKLCLSRVCQNTGRDEMATLHSLNAFISERLTAAAVDIFGAVEKTLTDYQAEISRSKEELDQLRRLLLWPKLKLHRISPHQVIPPSCDEEGLPEYTLHIKEEHEPRAGQQAPSSRHKSDTRESPSFLKRECHQESPLPSHLYQILTVKHSAITITEDIKAEPDGDGFISPSPREAEPPCGINPVCSGVQQETVRDNLETTPHEENGPAEQQHGEQDWSPSQDHVDSDPPQIKEEMFVSCGPEETDNDCKQSEKSVYGEPHVSSQDQTLRYRTFYTTEKMTRDLDGEGYEVSGPTRVPWPVYSVNADYPPAHGEYGKNEEGVEDKEWLKGLTPKRTKEEQNSNLCTEGRESIGVEAAVTELTGGRCHTCPICSKHFLQRQHLKKHMRIHAGEKPFQCKECGKNFTQSENLTSHMRTHTGERPYQCSLCGRRFTQKAHMVGHRVIHTGERPYQCSLCGRRFTRKAHMVSHRVIHTGERPYQCTECGRTFRWEGNLNSHLMTHTVEKMDH